MLGDWLSNPLKRRITQSLQNSLSRYISNVDLEGLGVGGDLVLRDLELRLDVLQESLNIPLSFVLTRGFIKELRITIPWAHLFSQAIRVKISTIECIVTARSELQFRRLQLKYERGKHAKSNESITKGNSQTSGSRSAPSLQSSQSNDSKTAQSSHEARKQDSNDDDVGTDDAGQQQSPGWIKSMLTKVLANAHVEINNLVIKYEHDNVVLSLALESLNLYSANPQNGWKPQYQEPTGPRQGIHKVCEARDLTVCLDRVEEVKHTNSSAHKTSGHSRVVQGFEVPILNKIQLTARTRVNLDPFAALNPPYVPDKPIRLRNTSMIRNPDPKVNPFHGIQEEASLAAIHDDTRMHSPVAEGKQVPLTATDWCIVAVLDLSVDDFHVAVSDRQFVMLGDLWVLPEDTNGKLTSLNIDHPPVVPASAPQSAPSPTTPSDHQASSGQAHSAPTEKPVSEKSKSSWTSWAWSAVVGEDTEKDPVLMEILEQANSGRDDVHKSHKPVFGVTVGALKVRSASITLLMHRQPSQATGPAPSAGFKQDPSPVVQVPVANLGVVPVDLTPRKNATQSSRRRTKLDPIVRMGATAFSLEVRSVEHVQGGSSLEVYLDVERFDIVSGLRGGDRPSPPPIAPSWSLSGVPTLPILLCGQAAREAQSDPPHPHALWSFFAPRSAGSLPGGSTTHTARASRTRQGMRVLARLPNSRQGGKEASLVEPDAHGELHFSSAVPAQVDAALSPLALRLESAFIKNFCDFLGVEARRAQSLAQPVLPDVKDGSAAAALQDLAAEYRHMVPKSRRRAPPLQVVLTVPVLDMSASAAVVGDEVNKEAACLSVTAENIAVYLEQDTQSIASELGGGLLLARHAQKRREATHAFEHLAPSALRPPTEGTSAWAHCDLGRLDCKLGIRGPLEYGAWAAPASRQSCLVSVGDLECDAARTQSRQKPPNREGPFSAEGSLAWECVQVSATLLQLKGALAILSTALGPLAEPLPEMALLATARPAPAEGIGDSESRRPSTNHALQNETVGFQVTLKGAHLKGMVFIAENHASKGTYHPENEFALEGVLREFEVEVTQTQESTPVVVCPGNQLLNTRVQFPDSQNPEVSDAGCVDFVFRGKQLPVGFVGGFAKMCGWKPAQDYQTERKPMAPVISIGFKLHQGDVYWDSYCDLLKWQQTADKEIKELLYSNQSGNSQEALETSNPTNAPEAQKSNLVSSFFKELDLEALQQGQIQVMVDVNPVSIFSSRANLNLRLPLFSAHGSTVSKTRNYRHEGSLEWLRVAVSMGGARLVLNQLQTKPLRKWEKHPPSVAHDAVLTDFSLQAELMLNIDLKAQTLAAKLNMNVEPASFSLSRRFMRLLSLLPSPPPQTQNASQKVRRSSLLFPWKHLSYSVKASMQALVVRLHTTDRHYHAAALDHTVFHVPSLVEVELTNLAVAVNKGPDCTITELRLGDVVAREAVTSSSSNQWQSKSRLGTGASSRNRHDGDYSDFDRDTSSHSATSATVARWCDQMNSLDRQSTQLIIRFLEMNDIAAFLNATGSTVPFELMVLQGFRSETATSEHTEMLLDIVVERVMLRASVLVGGSLMRRRVDSFDSTSSSLVSGNLSGAEAAQPLLFTEAYAYKNSNREASQQVPFVSLSAAVRPASEKEYGSCLNLSIAVLPFDVFARSAALTAVQCLFFPLRKRRTPSRIHLDDAHVDTRPAPTKDRSLQLASVNVEVKRCRVFIPATAPLSFGHSPETCESKEPSEVGDSLPSGSFTLLQIEGITALRDVKTESPESPSALQVGPVSCCTGTWTTLPGREVTSTDILSMTPTQVFSALDCGELVEFASSPVMIPTEISVRAHKEDGTSVVNVGIGPIQVEFMNKEQLGIFTTSTDALACLNSEFWYRKPQKQSVKQQPRQVNSATEVKTEGPTTKFMVSVPQAGLILWDEVNSQDPHELKTRFPLLRMHAENIQIDGSHTENPYETTNVFTIQDMYCTAMPDENAPIRHFFAARERDNRGEILFTMTSRVSGTSKLSNSSQTSIEISAPLTMHADGATYCKVLQYMNAYPRPEAKYRMISESTLLFTKATKYLAEDNALGDGAVKKFVYTPVQVDQRTKDTKWSNKVMIPGITMVAAVHLHGPAVVLSCNQLFAQQWSSAMSGSKRSETLIEPYPVSLDVSCIGAEITLPSSYRVEGSVEPPYLPKVLEDPDRIKFLERHEFRIVGKTGTKPLRTDYSIEFPSVRSTLSRDGLAIMSAVYEQFFTGATSSGKKRERGPVQAEQLHWSEADEDEHGRSDFTQLGRSFNRTGWPPPGKLCFTDLVHWQESPKDSSLSGKAHAEPRANQTSFGKLNFVPTSSPSDGVPEHWVALSWCYHEPRIVKKLTLQPLVLPPNVLESVFGSGASAVSVQLCSWDAIRREFHVIRSFEVPLCRLRSGGRSSGLSGLGSAFSEWMDRHLEEEDDPAGRKRRAKSTVVTVEDPWVLEPAGTWLLRWRVPEAKVNHAMTADTKELDHRFLAVSTVLASSADVRSLAHPLFFPLSRLHITAADLQVALVHNCQVSRRAHAAVQRQELLTVSVARFEHTRATFAATRPGALRRAVHRTFGQVGLTVQNFKTLCELQAVQPCGVEVVAASGGDGAADTQVRLGDLLCAFDATALLALHHGLQSFAADLAAYPVLARRLGAVPAAPARPLPPPAAADCQSCACMRYIVVNRTGAGLWFGQHATSEALLVPAGEQSAYSWVAARADSSPWPRMRFALDHGHVPGSWCAPLDIDAVGVRSRTLRYGAELAGGALLGRTDATEVWVAVQPGHGGLQTVVSVHASHVIVNNGPVSLEVRWLLQSPRTVSKGSSGTITNDSQMLKSPGTVRNNSGLPSPIGSVSNDPQMLNSPGTATNDSNALHSYEIPNGSECIQPPEPFHDVPGLQLPALGGQHRSPVMVPLGLAEREGELLAVLRQDGEAEWSVPVPLLGGPQPLAIALPGEGAVRHYWVTRSRAAVPGSAEEAWEVLELHPTCQVQNRLPFAVNCRVHLGAAGSWSGGPSSGALLEHVWLQRFDCRESLWPIASPTPLDTLRHTASRRASPRQMPKGAEGAQSSPFRGRALDGAGTFDTQLGPGETGVLAVDPRAEQQLFLQQEGAESWSSPCMWLGPPHLGVVGAGGESGPRWVRPVELGADACALVELMPNGQVSKQVTLTAPLRVVNETQTELFLRMRVVEGPEKDPAGLATEVCRLQAGQTTSVLSTMVMQSGLSFALSRDGESKAMGWSNDVPLHPKKAMMTIHVPCSGCFCSSSAHHCGEVDENNPKGQVAVGDEVSHAARFWVAEISCEIQVVDWVITVILRNRVVFQNLTGFPLELRFPPFDVSLVDPKGKIAIQVDASAVESKTESNESSSKWHPNVIVRESSENKTERTSNGTESSAKEMETLTSDEEISNACPAIPSFFAESSTSSARASSSISSWLLRGRATSTRSGSDGLEEHESTSTGTPVEERSRGGSDLSKPTNRPSRRASTTKISNAGMAPHAVATLVQMHLLRDGDETGFGEWSEPLFLPSHVNGKQMLKRFLHVPIRKHGKDEGMRELLLCSVVEEGGVLHVSVFREANPYLVVRNCTEYTVELADDTNRGGFTRVFPGEYVAQDTSLWKGDIVKQPISFTDVEQGVGWSLHQPNHKVDSIDSFLEELSSGRSKDEVQYFDQASDTADPLRVSCSTRSLPIGSGKFVMKLSHPTLPRCSGAWSSPLFWLSAGQQTAQLEEPPDTVRTEQSQIGSIGTAAASIISMVGQRLKASVGAHSHAEGLPPGPAQADQRVPPPPLLTVILESHTLGRCTTLHVRLADDPSLQGRPVILSRPKPATSLRISLRRFHVRIFDGPEPLASIAGAGLDLVQREKEAPRSLSLDPDWSAWAVANGLVPDGQLHRSTEMQLHRFQVDSCASYCELPVVIHFASSAHPLRLLCRRRLPPPAAAYPHPHSALRRPAHFTLVQAHVPDVWMGLEDVFLRRVAAFGAPLAAAIVAQRVAGRSSARPSAEGTSVTIQELHLGPVPLVVSAKSSDSFALALGTDRAPLSLSPIRLSHVHGQRQELVKDILASYAADALLGSPLVLGSLEILGNPAGLARSMGAGVRDLFLLPLESLQRGWGPGNVLRGVARGWTSLLLHLGDGTLSSLAGFSGSLARNLDRLSMDPRYIRAREARRRTAQDGPNRHALSQGLLRGAVGLGEGVLGAATGVVSMPLRAGAESGWGVSGVLRGVGKGLVGAVAKPMGGAAEFVAQTSDGIRLGSGMAAPVPHPQPPGEGPRWSPNQRLFVFWKVLRGAEAPLLVCPALLVGVALRSPEEAVRWPEGRQRAAVTVVLTAARIAVLSDGGEVAGGQWRQVAGWKELFERPGSVLLQLKLEEARRDGLVNFVRRTQAEGRLGSPVTGPGDGAWGEELHVAFGPEDRREFTKAMVVLRGR